MTIDHSYSNFYQNMLPGHRLSHFLNLRSHRNRLDPRRPAEGRPAGSRGVDPDRLLLAGTAADRGRAVPHRYRMGALAGYGEGRRGGVGRRSGLCGPPEQRRRLKMISSAAFGLFGSRTIPAQYASLLRPCMIKINEMLFRKRLKNISRFAGEAVCALRTGFTGACT